MFELGVLKEKINGDPYDFKKGLIVKTKPDSFMIRILTKKANISVMPSKIMSLNGHDQITPLKRTAEEYFKAVSQPAIDCAHLNICRSLLQDAYESVPKKPPSVQTELFYALVLLTSFMEHGAWYHPNAEDFFLCHIGNAILIIVQ